MRFIGVKFGDPNRLYQPARINRDDPAGCAGRAIKIAVPTKVECRRFIPFYPKPEQLIVASHIQLQAT
jgi:hypothetical protein